MVEISFSSAELTSDKTNLATYLAVNYDYDEIEDILSFKKPLPFADVDEKKAAEEERYKRFTDYMSDYKLEWGTYFDDKIKDSITHECAIAYRGNLDNFLKTDIKVCVESTFHVDNAFLEHEKRTPFWTVQALDHEFAMATFHKPTKSATFTDPDEQCVILGRIKTIIHMLYPRCENILATQGANWFAENIETEHKAIVTAEYADTTESTPHRKPAFLHAIPGKSGCNCNKLIKSFYWRLADTIADVLR